MSIQVIQHKQNPLSIGIVLIRQPLDLVCPINLGPVLFCICIPIFAKRCRLRSKPASGRFKKSQKA